jgi:TetR/AcrR family transcriptional repressor of nem operon
LVNEACAEALTTTAAGLATAAAKKPRGGGLRALVKRYLSTAHRDNPQDGCTFAALGSELTRADKKTRALLTERFSAFVELLAKQFDDVSPVVARKRALAAASTMIGALLMSRIVTDPDLSQALLKNAEQRILED